jgi:2-methylcitrate dehydratase PrpD
MAKIPADRKRSAELCRELTEWATVAVTKPLPAPVRRRASLILADDLGAIIAGSQEDQVAQAQAILARSSIGQDATVFAKAAPRLDRYQAASANGMAITWCELDEGFRNASCHSGAYTIPTLLSEAETRNLSVSELVQTLAVAYELTTRFALAYPFPRFNVHPHAAFATLGAAVASSLARRQDAKTMLTAITGAASMTFAGPFDTAVEGALVRNAWTSIGPTIGMRSADFAEVGIGGRAETIYDVFVDCLGTNARVEALTEALGERWSVASGYHKVYACCGYAHSAVQATLELSERLGKRSIDDVTNVIVETSPGGLALTTVEPETVLAAKFSVPHSIAATMVVGNAGRRAFTESTLDDVAIADMRRRVKLVPYPNLKAWPNDRPARVTWKFRDGEEWSAVCESARGGADQPFDDATLLLKLRDNAAEVFPNLPDLAWKIVDGDSEVLGLPWRDAVAGMVAGAKQTGVAA